MPMGKALHGEYECRGAFRASSRAAEDAARRARELRTMSSFLCVAEKEEEEKEEKGKRESRFWKCATKSDKCFSNGRATFTPSDTQWRSRVSAARKSFARWTRRLHANEKCHCLLLGP